MKCVTEVYECVERIVRVNEDMVERHQKYMYNVVVAQASRGFELARIMIGSRRTIQMERASELCAWWSEKPSTHCFRHESVNVVCKINIKTTDYLSTCKP